MNNICELSATTRLTHWAFMEKGLIDTLSPISIIGPPPAPPPPPDSRSGRTSTKPSSYIFSHFSLLPCHFAWSRSPKYREISSDLSYAFESRYENESKTAVVTHVRPPKDSHDHDDTARFIYVLAKNPKNGQKNCIKLFLSDAGYARPAF